MPETLIFVGTHVVKTGMTDAASAASQDLAKFLEQSHPRILHFEIDIDDDAHEMTVIQIHPDAESLMEHVRLAGDRIRAAYEFLEGTSGIEIYGTVTPELVDLVDKMSMGAPVRFNQRVAGFSRLS